MGAISVVLGLLPAGLTQIGPSTSRFSLLASRRPLLATLLSFGALTVLPMDPETGASLRKPVRVPNETGLSGQQLGWSPGCGHDPRVPYRTRRSRQCPVGSVFSHLSIRLLGRHPALPDTRSSGNGGASFLGALPRRGPAALAPRHVDPVLPAQKILRGQGHSI